MGEIAMNNGVSEALKSIFVYKKWEIYRKFNFFKFFNKTVVWEITQFVNKQICFSFEKKN